MTQLNPYKLQVLKAYDAGLLKPSAGRAELQRMRAAARATAIQDQRGSARSS